MLCSMYSDDTSWMMDYIRLSLPSDLRDLEYRLKDLEDDMDIDNNPNNNLGNSWLGYSNAEERFVSPSGLNNNIEAVVSNNGFSKKNEASVQTVNWQQNIGTLSQGAIDNLFPARKNDGRPGTKISSTLAFQVANFSNIKDNDFGFYSHYDGRGLVESKAQRRRRTCQFRVFISLPTDIKGSVKSQHYDVVVLATAEVQHVIGLVCWLYARDGHQSKLSSSVDDYDIVIAEEDGTPEDLPPLDRFSSITRYDFKFLALVPRRQNRIDSRVSENCTVRVILPDGNKEVALAIDPQEQSVGVRDITEKAVNHVPKTIDYDFEYELMADDVVLGKDERVRDWRRRQFQLVRANSKHVSEHDEAAAASNTLSSEARKTSLLAVLEAPMYQEFAIYLHWQGRTECTLCISAKKIDLIPRDSEKAELLFKTEPDLFSLDTKQVVKSEIKDVKDHSCLVKVTFARRSAKTTTIFNRSSFNGYLKFKFDCDPRVAEAIVSKLDTLRDAADGAPQ